MTCSDLFARLRLPEDAGNPLQVALRTYGLAFFLSATPGLTSVIASIASTKTVSHAHLARIRKVLGRELRPNGLASAFTVAVGGGAALQSWWDKEEANTTASAPTSSSRPRRVMTWLQELSIPEMHKTFISYCITSSVCIFLLQSKRRRDRPSRTLDLTLLLFVRAFDAAIQTFVFHRTSRVRENKPAGPSQLRPEVIRHRLLKGTHEQLQKERRDVLTTRIDGFVFWACSARIMWCFFHEPTSLPQSYVRWISALANVDDRLLRTLQLIRTGEWSYTRGSREHAPLLETYSTDLGHPALWGNPTSLPAHGGLKSQDAWKALGVTNRPGLGGLPCELVHGGVGASFGLNASCTSNTLIRALKAFTQCLFLIYIPVHFAPALLTKPKIVLRPHRLAVTLLAAMRSASFLSAFIASFWYAVCATRTLVLARLLPMVSHDFWDGPLGCVMAGCLACGSSIWIEHPRRRGEMALYVLPRAIRTLIPVTRRSGFKFGERAVFVLSLSTLLTTAAHQPDSLRGLSRWALAFVLNGPNAGFWKKRRAFDPSLPVTPAASTPSSPRL